MAYIAKKKNGNWNVISITSNDLNHMGVDDDVGGDSVINSSLNVEAYQSKLVRSI